MKIVIDVGKMTFWVMCHLGLHWWTDWRRVDGHWFGERHCVNCERMVLTSYGWLKEDKDDSRNKAPKD